LSNAADSQGLLYWNWGKRLIGEIRRALGTNQWQELLYFDFG
jgi:hypothetical protein